MKEKKKTTKNAVKDWRPIWLYLILSVIGTIIAMAAGTAISMEQGLAVEEASTKYLIISNIFIDFTLLIVFGIIYRKKILESIKKLDKKNIITIVVAAILLITINDIISNVLASSGVESANQELIVKYMGIYEIPMIIMTVICAPFIEEMVFRYAIGTICKNNIVFVIISGVLFGLAHATNIYAILYIFIGVSLAIIYLKSNKNIMVPIGVHLLNNLASVLMMFLVK